MSDNESERSLTRSQTNSKAFSASCLIDGIAKRFKAQAKDAIKEEKAITKKQIQDFVNRPWGLFPDPMKIPSSTVDFYWGKLKENERILHEGGEQLLHQVSRLN